MSNQSHGASPIGIGAPGPIVAVLFLAGVVSVWSLFELSLALGISMFAFLAVCIFLLSEVDENAGMVTEVEHKAAIILLFLTMVGALLLYPLAIYSHVVPFAIAGWAIMGLFYASLIAGAWVAVSALGRMLAMIAGTATVAALVVLPAPAESADPTDKESEWRIELTVLDEQSNPLQHAVAQCSATMVWDGDSAVKFGARLPQWTQEDGIASFTFHEDTRLKVALCTAFKDSEAASFTQSVEENFARAFYPPKSVSMASPTAGGDYKLTLKLERRPGAGCNETVNGTERILSGPIVSVSGSDAVRPMIVVLDQATRCRVSHTTGRIGETDCLVGQTFRHTRPHQWNYVYGRLSDGIDARVADSNAFECQ